jgi:hypothetical protein
MSTTVRTIGATAREHATISLWELATDNDLVTGTVIEEGRMFDDANFAEIVSIAGAVTNALYYRHLTAAPGEEFDPFADTGTWLETAGSAFMFTIGEGYFRLSKMGARNNQGGNGVSFYWSTNADNSLGSSLYGQRGNGTGTPFQIANTANNVTLINCIADGLNNAGTWTGFVADNAGYSNHLYNCIVYDIHNVGSTGVYWRGGGNVQNVICLDTNGTDFNVSVTGTESNNASSDGTAAGSGSLTSQNSALVWTDPDSKDFTLLGGSNAIGAGIDLSGVFTLDFLGNPHGVAAGGWDMGAYAELGAGAAGGSLTSKYYHYYLDRR